MLFKAIKAEIKNISRQKISDEIHRDKKFDEYRARVEKRSGVPSTSKPKPTHKRDWFNPKYCARNANSIAKWIWRDLQNGSYKPQSAKRFDIPKKGGGTRELTAFSIPDSAVAKLIYRSIVRRNLRVFSDSSFAYLPDRDIFDAIRSLGRIDQRSKVFAIQIDFKKFFDLIPHEYLEDLMNGKGEASPILRMTAMEQSVIRAFMVHDSDKFVRTKKRSCVEAQGPRSVGTPQGSSISLVLANLALHELDTELNLLSGKFVRYADDVVAMTATYEQALAVEHAFHWHADTNGLKINREKSPGIAAFATKDQEIRTISEIDFLGYRFLFSGTTISEEVEHKLRRKISRLINLYLHHYIKRSFNYYRCSAGPVPFDWDLLGLISELRRSIYGGNSEKEIRDSLYREARIKRMHGIMPHYSLITDEAPFRRLDGWMVNSIRRAMVFRNQRIQGISGASTYQACPLPNNAQLIEGTWLDPDAWRQTHDDEPMPETKMPSFVRAWRAAKIHAKNHGIPRTDKGLNASNEDIADLFEYF